MRYVELGKSAIDADYLLIVQKNVSRNGKAIMGAEISLK